MQVEYRRILTRRRAQIANIRWTREMATACARHSLLSTDQLRQTEDLSEDNRMQSVLSILMQHAEVGAFEKFRKILEECGHQAMVESLDFDRSRIQWAFEKQPHYGSLCDYIDHLNADLLQASVGERDEYRRGRLIVEAQRRLAELRHVVRQLQQDRDFFRWEMWTLLTADKQQRNSATDQSPNFVSVSEIEDAECRKDEALLKATREWADSMECRVTTLQQQNEELRRALADNEIELDAASTQLMVGDDDQLPKQVIAEQPMSNHLEHTLRLNKIQFDQLLASLQPLTSLSLASSHLQNTNADKLIVLLQSAATELESLRKRSGLLSSHVERLKKDREAIASELGLSGTVASDSLSISQCIHDRLLELDTLRTIANSSSHRDPQTKETDFTDSGFECFKKVTSWQMHNELLSNYPDASKCGSNRTDYSRKPYAVRSEPCHAVLPKRAHLMDESPRRHSLPLENTNALMKSKRNPKKN